MTKRKPSGKKSQLSTKSHQTGSAPKDDQSAEGLQRHVPSAGAIRETIESVVVAFVLAFLFRTFEAEAFVIPTGSMAPTLMGRHKDLECPMCGYQYQASASEEVDQFTNELTGNWIEASTCPMCRYNYRVGRAQKVFPERYPDYWKKYPSYTGDRILVGKFCYQFADPERWDVVVFKYPGDARFNYVKRLVGKPGETIHIQHGDIFVEPPEGEPSIARKGDIKKLMAMLQPVYDNDFAMPEVIEAGWPARWQPWPGTHDGSPGAWTSSEDFRSFRTEGDASATVWIRYQHTVPVEWQTLSDDTRLPAGAARPQLISDFCAYNTGEPIQAIVNDRDRPGIHWVGDLAVRCQLQVLSSQGQAILELVEGGWRMQCQIDVATGAAALSVENPGLGQDAQTIDGETYGPTAATNIKGPGAYDVLFANCDDQLWLWIDGRAIAFDTTTCYAPLDNYRPVDTPAASDLRPVSIGSQGAGLEVAHLQILRDIYYIAEKDPGANSDGLLSDYENVGAVFGIRPANLTPEVIADFFSDPCRWGVFDNMREATFPLEADQFLVLGDNSAKSRDSRLWGRDNFEYYVRRDLLIGKALYIYWPHSWDKIPGTDIPFPMFPNFANMGFVR